MNSEDTASSHDADSGSYARELEVAVAAARAAGRLLTRYFRPGQPSRAQSWEKSENNPVTQADLDADTAIREHLTSHFPDDGLLSEESEDDPNRLTRTRCWIVDPIDGTREFIKGIPEFAISIGLVRAGIPVVGVVFNPVVDALYAARLGNGCHRNGAPVRVSSCPRLSQARVVASHSELKSQKLEPYRDDFASLEAVGSIAWKLALVAGGEVDFNISLRPKREWDVCAGDLLVREAGGHYMDFERGPRRYNQPDPLSRRPMAAGSPTLLDDLLSGDRIAAAQAAAARAAAEAAAEPSDA